MIDHAVKIQLSAQHAASQARRERLALAREKERKIRQQSNSGLFKGKGERKRLKVDSSIDEHAERGDDEFLPEDQEGAMEEVKEGEIYLTKEVKELMAK